MRNIFFNELNTDSPKGVAFKNINFKKQIVGHFANSGNSTIAELCKEFNLSAPKVTIMINELIEDGMVKDYGKVQSTGGRKPNIYGLEPDSGFFMGIDVKSDSINIGLIDFQKKLIKLHENYPYELKNDQEALEKMCQIIDLFIKQLGISKDKILCIGVNLSGRVNHTTGYSYSYFHFHEDPLSDILEKRFGIKVFLENDSNAMAVAEYTVGNLKDEKDVLFLNLDYGTGLGIIIGRDLYYGKSGYSGEFGHIPIFENEIICRCGKKGCMETEASGKALERIFKEKLKQGSSSLLTKKFENIEQIKLKDIMEAANQDDVLAIELVAEIGEKLGRGVALLINIFNPELVILGGPLAQTGDYLRLPVISAVNKYSLSLMNNDTQIKISTLGSKAGVIGAGLIARNNLLTLL